MTAKIYKFPLERTKIGQWIREAHSVAAQTNLVGARVWSIKNVPLEFREIVLHYVNNLLATNVTK